MAVRPSPNAHVTVVEGSIASMARADIATVPWIAPVAGTTTSDSVGGLLSYMRTRASGLL